MSSTATEDPRLSPRTSNESNDTISLMSLSTHQNIQQSTITNPVPNIENGKTDSRQETTTENSNRVQKKIKY